MIEIIDKINNTIKIIKDLEIAIHPLTNQVVFLEDYQILDKYIYGVIFDEQGILFCYKNILDLETTDSKFIIKKKKLIKACKGLD